MKKPTRASPRTNRTPVKRYIDEFKVLEFLLTHEDDEEPEVELRDWEGPEDLFICQRYEFEDLRAMLDSVDGAHMLPNSRLDDIASNVDGSGTRREVIERLEELVDEELDAIEEEDDFVVSEAESSDYDGDEEEEEEEAVGSEEYREEEDGEYLGNEE